MFSEAIAIKVVLARALFAADGSDEQIAAVFNAVDDFRSRCNAVQSPQKLMLHELLPWDAAVNSIDDSWETFLTQDPPAPKYLPPPPSPPCHRVVGMNWANDRMLGKVSVVTVTHS